MAIVESEWVETHPPTHPSTHSPTHSLTRMSSRVVAIGTLGPSLNQPDPASTPVPTPVPTRTPAAPSPCVCSCDSGAKTLSRANPSEKGDNGKSDVKDIEIEAN